MQKMRASVFRGVNNIAIEDGPLKLDQRIAHERLSRLCFIDHDREMALVAERRDFKTGQPEILRVGRLSSFTEPTKRSLQLS